MKATCSPTQTETSSKASALPGFAASPHSPSRKAPLWLAAVMAFAALAGAEAAPITMVQSNTASGQSWLTPAAWSDNAIPTAGNTYFVTGTAFTVRTPQPGAASYTFGGDSLTINNARMLFATLGGSNITVSNLTLTNGGMFANGTSATQTLSGTLAISGSAFVRLHSNAAEAARNITIASQITGSGNVGLIQKGTLTLTGAGNTFSGTWTVGGANVVTPDGTWTNTSGLISTLVGSSSGSLGVDSSVTLNIWSRLDLNYDWTTSGALTLADNAGNATSIIMTLDQSITVGSLSVAGFSFGAGTYDYTDLSTAGYGDYFTNGGGSITVVPEPRSLGLLLLGSVGIVLWGRRLRTTMA